MVDKLKKIAKQAIECQYYEKALAAISASADILYGHNQIYTDEELEQDLLQIAEKMFPNESISGSKTNYTITNRQNVLFYDGFGLDTRGLALIFLKALVENGYHVIYVTKEQARGNQPEIEKAVNGYDMQWIYIPMEQSYITWISGLVNAFETYQPNVAFFYTTPFDAAATLVFDHYKGKVIRYQIDLTDHAFWLGKYAFDYCVELRDVGSKISFNYRGVPKHQLVMIPYYATIDYEAPFEGFPFSIEGYRVIFSGGALYKTLGDKKNRYYKIVDSILSSHNDIIFLYAGYGDDSQLVVLQNKYPQRVYHIAERKDLYQVMQHCVLYINTYPMFGGLMMHYAVAAGKIPITLKHNHDADGLLFNQSNIGVEYDTMEELLSDVDKLLSEPIYLAKREDLLADSIISEEKFREELKKLVDIGKTEYDISIEYIDTTEFRKEFDERFNYKKNVKNAIVNRRNFPLALEFPMLFLETCLYKIKNKIIGGRIND